MAPILGYWDIRGLAEPIRYLLHYKGQDFKDKRYDTSTDDWQKDKFSLGLDFPNLPYYIDGDLKLTQSLAILRYLARKHGLAGTTESEQLRVEVVEQELIDFRRKLTMPSYSPDFETKIKPDLVKAVPSHLKLFSAFLGNRKFLAGDSITYVDFIAYDTFDYYWLLIPHLLEGFPNLKNYVTRLQQLPELQSYYKSKEYRRWPFLLPSAYFGGKGEEPKRV